MYILSHITIFIGTVVCMRVHKISYFFRVTEFLSVLFFLVFLFYFVFFFSSSRSYFSPLLSRRCLRHLRWVFSFRNSTVSSKRYRRISPTSEWQTAERIISLFFHLISPSTIALNNWVPTSVYIFFRVHVHVQNVSTSFLFYRRLWSMIDLAQSHTIDPLSGFDIPTLSSQNRFQKQSFDLLIKWSKLTRTVKQTKSQKKKGFSPLKSKNKYR